MFLCNTLFLAQKMQTVPRGCRQRGLSTGTVSPRPLTNPLQGLWNLTVSETP